MASLLPRVDYCEEREREKNEFIKWLDGHWWNIIFLSYGSFYMHDNCISCFVVVTVLHLQLVCDFNWI